MEHPDDDNTMSLANIFHLILANNLIKEKCVRFLITAAKTLPFLIDSLLSPDWPIDSL